MNYVSVACRKEEKKITVLKSDKINVRFISFESCRIKIKTKTKHIQKNLENKNHNKTKLQKYSFFHTSCHKCLVSMLHRVGRKSTKRTLPQTQRVSKCPSYVKDVVLSLGDEQ